MQKLLILSAIKYHLQHFHMDNQRETFDDLNLAGAIFEEIMASPDIRLSSTPACDLFAESLFSGLLIGEKTFILDSSEKWLLAYIANTRYFPAEKAFLSAVILAEPELILNMKHYGRDETIFKNITKELIKQAQHNIVHEPSIQHIIMQESFLQSIFGKEVNLNNLSDKIFGVVNDTAKR